MTPPAPPRLARSLLPALALALAAGCALPVVSANTFLPAGDLKSGDLRASASLEVGRVLAAPVDVELDPSKVPARAAKWEVQTWVASDVSVLWAPFDRLALEAQLKISNPIDPFTPVPVGGALGARVRLLGRSGRATGWAVELGPRLVGVRVTEECTTTSATTCTVQPGVMLQQRTDRWTWRALGAELPLVITDRISPLLALTASPFVRGYFIRAWHDVIASDGSASTTKLQWTPVFSAGLGGSVAMQLGPVEIAPGLALELVTRPGPGATLQLIVEPGIAFAVTW